MNELVNGNRYQYNNNLFWMLYFLPTAIKSLIFWLILTSSLYLQMDLKATFSFHIRSYLPV